MADPFWPRLDTRESSLKAVRNGSQAAYVVAAVSGAIAIGSLVTGAPIAGMSGWSLVDAVLAGLIGWRISGLSLPWAIAGLAYWVLNVVSKIVDGIGVGAA